MTIVAFDTSTSRTVVAVRSGEETLETVLEAPGGGHPAHSAQLLPAIDSLLAQSSTGWGETTRIGVGAGPGTFTGLRISAATAEGLRRATRAEVVPVPSLEALARSLPEGDRDLPVVAVIDARRGEVFCAAWSAEGKEIFGPTAEGPQEFAGRLSREAAKWRLSGELPAPFEDALAGSGLIGLRGPTGISGTALCELAASLSPVHGPVMPLYVREPDAVKVHG